MAQKTVVTLTDDLDGKDIPEGKGETVRFSLDGQSYEIDLKDKHATDLRKTVGPFVVAARIVKTARGRSVGPKRRATLVNTITQRTASQRVRQWARANGYDVSDRGRISQEVQDAYDEANP